MITNHWLREVIVSQLPGVPAEHVMLAEPWLGIRRRRARWRRFCWRRREPETVIGVFPSDHVVGNKRFAEVLAAGIKVAAAGENIVVLGVPPTRPETGYGYIEKGARSRPWMLIPVHRVRRFREKPDRHTAERFLAAGNFAWNGGIFLWSAKTLANAIREHVPDMAPLLEKIAAAYGTPEFERCLRTSIRSARTSRWTMRCWSGGR